VLPCSLYFAIGKNFADDNLINIAAVLFMWSTLPAFGAAAYVPAIVLERPLFTRHVLDKNLKYIVVTDPYRHLIGAIQQQ